MVSYSIPDPDTLQREIKASHQRCRDLGVNPAETRNPRQKKLTQEELTIRSEQNREFLEIAISQIEELYQFVAGLGFAEGKTVPSRQQLLKFDREIVWFDQIERVIDH